MDGCVEIVGINSVAHHADRDVDAGFAQHVAHKVGHDPDSVEVAIEVLHHGAGNTALFPTEVFAGDPTGGVDDSRGPHLSDDNVGVGNVVRPTKEASGFRVTFKVFRCWLIVPRALGRVNRGSLDRRFVETERQPAVHRRKAVARFEGALNLYFQR